MSSTTPPTPSPAPQSQPAPQAQPSLRPAPEKRPPKPKRRVLKTLGKTVIGAAALVVGATAVLWWWAGTDGSLATVLGWAGRTQPLVANGVTGSLRTGGHIDQLQWQQDGLSVKASDISLAWQPWALLNGTVQLDRLTAGQVQVTDRRAPSSTPATLPDHIRLPVKVVLGELAVAQLQWQGATSFAASGLSAHYEYTGLQHQLVLNSLGVAQGQYRGKASLNANAPLTLDAKLSGAVSVAMPVNPEALPLVFQASASGPLKDLQVQADLNMAAEAAAASATDPAAKTPQTEAKVNARVTAFAAQPLAQADATFRDLDVAALWPEGPQTLLSGSAHVQPAQTAAPASPDHALVWALQLQLTNALPGPWDRHRLPLDKLQAQGEWRGGVALVQSLTAQLAGGQLEAKGQWSQPPAADTTTPNTASPAGVAPAWQANAVLQGIDPAQLHSRLGPLRLNGRAEAQGQGALTTFDASLQAANGAGSSPKRVPTSPRSRTKSSPPPVTLEQLRLRDAKATGSWNAEKDGGTLVLSALRIRTDDAELKGQIEAQPAALGGKGVLSLTAPGLNASVKGELRKTTGNGSLSLQGRDAAQALRWLQSLPGMPASVMSASARGSAELQASWKGGWQDPAVQARLDAPSLDWLTKPAPGKAVASSAATAQTAPAPPENAGLIKLRALQATLSGRLSQAQLTAQGRAEVDQRRFALQLAAQGGRVKPRGAMAEASLADSAWQGLISQLSLSVEDPALASGGAWELVTRSAVPLKWTPMPQGGAFESGAGQAVLKAPPASAQAGAPSQARLSWQPVRWRPGELVTSGTLSGLPLAWIELLAGPQMAGAGLGGNLIFEGQWDAVLTDKLRLKASLARTSGDISLQAEGLQGNSTRVSAGVKEAHLSLENAGDTLTLALRWSSDHAGTADGKLTTRLSRAPESESGGWQWAANAPLNGQLRAQLPRIGVWSLLAPPGWRLRGSLDANIAIKGTRAAPSLSGTLQADDLALRSVVDGIEFGNGRLRAQLDGTRLKINEFTLQGAGAKGAGGSLTAHGEASWEGGKPDVRLDAKLDKLRASLRTDRQLTLSGNVQAHMIGNATQITGKLLVDQARILLPDESTPKLGDDVVVRTARGAASGQEGPGKASGTQLDPQPKAPAVGKEHGSVKLAVDIDLGRDFRVQGKGIDTLLRGTLALTGDSLSEPRLIGTIRTADGKYRAYGQRLDIERGRIRFTGALDNPTLDVLAIRPNMTQRVGVQITGTALLPDVRLYAQPDMPDAEKLSWLVVGHASASGGAETELLQQAALALLGGQGGGLSGGLAASLGLDELSFRGGSEGSVAGGSVTLGKRFSRNFYAAYQRSISGATGTLFIFYDLSRRFTVRAEAGEQSAVDLIYTFAYD
ncbi:MAG: translocation/assembly module TamB domain-containing protein [Polaromonas sp.]